STAGPKSTPGCRSPPARPRSPRATAPASAAAAGGTRDAGTARRPAADAATAVPVPASATGRRRRSAPPGTAAGPRRRRRRPRSPRRATVRGARPRRPRTRAAAPVPGPAAGAPLNHRPLCCPRRASATHREARMARRYTAMTRGQRIGNAVVALLVRIGLGPKDTYLLTVPGRRTGKPYTTPVTLVQTGEGRWLVAPYGAVSGVRSGRVVSHTAPAPTSRSKVNPYGHTGPGFGWCCGSSAYSS